MHRKEEEARIAAEAVAAAAAEEAQRPSMESESEVTLEEGMDGWTEAHPDGQTDDLGGASGDGPAVTGPPDARSKEGFADGKD